jgi:hypothetical protein
MAKVVESDQASIGRGIAEVQTYPKTAAPDGDDVKSYRPSVPALAAIRII